MFPRLSSGRAFALTSLALLLPLFAAAQSVGSTAPFTISVSPQNLAPYSSASISVLSTSLDLPNATMTVSVDGAKTYTGNVQPVAVPLGGSGSRTTVKVTLTTNGQPYTASVVLVPQDVALVAEPVSSAPALYPGKPLVPLEGATRVVAVANLRTASGKPIDPAALAYTWTVDGTVEGNASGIGKEAILVASPLEYRSRDISVSVSSQDGTLGGGAALSLTPQEPTVRIYGEDPLLGILFDHAFTGTAALTGSEASLFGAAYSFPTSGGAPSLTWYLNGATAQTGSTLTLRPTGSGQGSAGVSLSATAGTYANANASLTLTFGAQPSTNLFGL